MNTTELTMNGFPNTTYNEWLINKLYTYIAIPIGTLFGVSFNLLTIIVILKSKLWKSTFFRYLVFLAISDMIVCLSYVLRSFGAVFGHILTPKIFTITDCKLFLFFNFTFSQASSFLLVLITIDRYICIAHPIKAKIWSTLSICNRIVIVIFFYVFAVDFFFFFAVKRSERVSKLRIICSVDTPAAEFIVNYFFTYFNLVYSIIPSGIIIVLNILIFGSLKEHISELGSTNDANKKDSMKIVVRRLSIMSVMISTVFIFLTLPLGIFDELVNRNVIVLSDVKRELIFDTIFICNLLNHLINFVFYCACGQTFRTELLKIFCKSNKENGIELSSKSLTQQTAT